MKGKQIINIIIPALVLGWILYGITIFIINFNDLY